MSLSHVIRRQAITPAGNVGGDATIAAGAENNISETISASATDVPVAFTFANAKLQSIVISAPAAMTIKTNSSGSAQETVTVVPGEPFVWTRTGSRIGAVASPFAGDVTGLYVTSSAGGLLDIRSVVDPT